MTVTVKMNMPMSGSKERLKKALSENIENYTISRDGRILMKKEILLKAFKRELEKIDDSAINGMEAKKAG